jgi:hypothetical protein
MTLGIRTQSIRERLGEMTVTTRQAVSGRPGGREPHHLIDPPARGSLPRQGTAGALYAGSRIVSVGFPTHGLGSTRWVATSTGSTRLGVEKHREQIHVKGTAEKAPGGTRGKFSSQTEGPARRAERTRKYGRPLDRSRWRNSSLLIWLRRASDVANEKAPPERGQVFQMIAATPLRYPAAAAVRKAGQAALGVPPIMFRIASARRSGKA